MVTQSFCLFLILLSQVVVGQSARPNVLLIISDDQGYGDLGFMGNPVLKTPHLDSLARSSARLTNFHVSPVCSPSRASLLTGRYSYRTGVWDTWMGRADLHPDEQTIAELLAKAGYRTGLFGKWHLGTNVPKRPQDQGFQEVYASTGARFDPAIQHNGVTKKEKGFIDDLITDAAIRFMTAPGPEPFLAVVASVLPHDLRGPQVPEPYVTPYRNVPGLRPGDQEVYGMMAKLDKNVGRLLGTLRQRGLDQNTIVVFVSDNGPLQNTPDLQSLPEQLACREKDMGLRYNAGLRGGKATVYEGGIRVPCFVRWPARLRPNRDVPALTAHIDLLPTLLDWLNVPKPRTLDGISLASLLDERTQRLPNRTYVVQSDRSEVPMGYAESAVLRGTYKLVNGAYLYDLATDPGEQHDLAAQQPKRVARLQRAFRQWQASVSKGLKPSYTLIGSAAQPVVVLSAQDKFSTGWPVRVAEAGTFRVVVNDVQPSLFVSGSHLKLRIGTFEQILRVDPAQTSLTFGPVSLTPGDYTLDILPVGVKHPKTLYYGNEDPGYRTLTIQR
jgi:arylsulfatase A-like enzyme